jgi:AcrR family transcriptional regulator
MTARKPSAVRRIEIADAALSIVATHGIGELTTRSLAKAVGLSTGALFKHYVTRDAMLLAMAERAAELLRTTFPAGNLSPTDRLRDFAAARVALVSGQSGILAVVMCEQFALALPAEATAVIQQAIRDTHAYVGAALEQGQRDGTVRNDVSAEGLALLFMGAMQVTVLARRTQAVTGVSAFDALHVLMAPHTEPVEDTRSPTTMPLPSDSSDGCNTTDQDQD